MSRRSGRRPGVTRNREEIRATAERLFGERGYDRTSLRAIAAEAGVDPALVRYFFGSKQALFVEAMRLPFDPAAEIAAVFAGDRTGLGERLARFILTTLERDDARQRMVGLVRAAASEPTAAERLRELIGGEVMSALAENLGVEDAPVRANLAGSQVVGLIMARYIVRVEPLASMPAEDVIAAIAPTLQRYLTGPVGGP
ncbi:MAG TPA: TetR family transcriptional regulator [Solirubrobacterales bacterium]